MDFYEGRRKKVLIFSLAYVPFIGGAELAVKEITDRVSEYEFDLVTLCFDKKWPKFEKIGNINIYRIGGGKALFPFLAFCKAGRLNRKRKYDLIWSIMANRAGFAVLFFKMFFPKIKFLLTLQEGDAEDYPEKRMGIFRIFLKPIFRKIFTKADYIQVISNYLADWAKQNGAICLIEVVPNGVGCQKHQGLSLTSRRVLDVRVVITTSRLVHKNGIDVLIKAAGELKKTAPDLYFKVQILGAGPDEKKLKDLAKELKVENIVQFLGHIAPEKIYDYLAQADVFVRPSRSEGLGSAFLEAMAAGLPIIGTSVGGIPDFLEDRKTGLFAEMDNPQDLVLKIKESLENENLRQTLIQNGLNLVKQKYDWNLIAGKMKNIFEKLTYNSV